MNHTASARFHRLPLNLAIGLALAAGLALLGTSTAHASVVTVDSVKHGVWGYSHSPSSGAPTNLGALNTGVNIAIGDTVTISTAVTDTWIINGLTVNARGWGVSNKTDLGFAGQTALQYGSLAYSLDGMLWGSTFDDVNNFASNDTDVSFVATKAGSLRLAMWDSIVNDNGGADTSLLATINVVPAASTNVPEPASLALVALALAGVGVSRRKHKA
jgi:hypothetical protein